MRRLVVLAGSLVPPASVTYVAALRASRLSNAECECSGFGKHLSCPLAVLVGDGGICQPGLPLGAHGDQFVFHFLPRGRNRCSRVPDLFAMASDGFGLETSGYGNREIRRRIRQRPLAQHPATLVYEVDDLIYRRVGRVLAAVRRRSPTEARGRASCRRPRRTSCRTPSCRGC